MAYPGKPHRLGIGPVFDDDLDVVQFLPKVFGKCIQCLGHQALKLIPVHGSHIIAFNMQFGT